MQPISEHFSTLPIPCYHCPKDNAAEGFKMRHKISVALLSHNKHYVNHYVSALLSQRFALCVLLRMIFSTLAPPLPYRSPMAKRVRYARHVRTCVCVCARADTNPKTVARVGGGVRKFAFGCAPGRMASMVYSPQTHPDRRSSKADLTA